jgi:hypothetical protein
MARDSFRATALFLVLFFVTLLGSGFIVTVFGPGDSDDPAFLLTFGIALIVISWGLHWPVGMLVNSRSTPQGRQWHNTYRLSGSLPLQYGGAPYTLIAWFAVSFSIGDMTARWVGWVVLLLVPPLMLAAAIFVSKRIDAARGRSDDAS